MAYRTIINKVLRRLREETVAADWIGALPDSEADDYQKLIGDFVNEAKQIVEDASSWSFLSSLQSVTTSAGTATYAIPSATNRSTVLQVIDDTNDYVIPQMSDSDFYNFTYVGTPQDGNALYYRLNGNNISFYPTPDGVHSIKIHLVIPQDDLSEATDSLTVPEQPVTVSYTHLTLPTPPYV